MPSLDFRNGIHYFLKNFRPEEHSSSPAHAKIKDDYVKWMKRKLKFQPKIQENVLETFETIARKMDLKTSQVTYVGIHNRRSKEFNDYIKKGFYINDVYSWCKWVWNLLPNLSTKKIKL